MRTFFLSTFCVAASFSATAALAQTPQTKIEPMQTGLYEPTWESLAQYECPEWFRDAKFGIWAHWGPQCQPEAGDWYARHMYYKGEGQHDFHVKKYGDPKEFGFKDVINEWKAEEWDPDALIKLYKRVGAKYFMALGNHHDNMDLWDSQYQPWNSVNVGPKKDIIGGWAKACEKYGLPFGVSIHAAHAWSWYEGSQDYDGNLTKADGKGKWWEGLDPQDLYAQRHPRSKGSENVGTIHSQWNWGGGVTPPSEAFITNIYNRTLDVVNKYHPTMLYFDDTVLPFYPISDIGLKIAAHLYNRSRQLHHGNNEAVVMGKILSEQQKKCILWDVERGAPDKAQQLPWQTCTCIGDWHYNRSVYDQNRYRSASAVIKMLVDVVSKNGNLLLSVPLRGNGSLDEKEKNVLEGIAAWMEVNGESIYGTRPWVLFGEGPSAETARPLNAQGFNEGQSQSATDIRYVKKNGSLYVTALGWPESRFLKLKALAINSGNYQGKVKSVELLGYGRVEYRSTEDGLKVLLPSAPVNAIAPVLKVKFTRKIQ